MEASSQVPRPSDPSLRRLVDFYDPSVKGPDGRNRTFDGILAWNDDRLESQHDYIQTLFPLPEGSIFSFIAPIIDEETFLFWRQHDGLKDNMRRAFARILAFYGFEIRAAPQQQQSEAQAGTARTTIEEAADSGPKLARWVCRMDHNHLRITRIIRSLRVLGLEGEAGQFYAALVRTRDRYGKIGSRSVQFWQRAARSPLHIAPDGDRVAWLEKYGGAAAAGNGFSDSDG